MGSYHVPTHNKYYVRIKNKKNSYFTQELKMTHLAVCHHKTERNKDHESSFYVTESFSLYSVPSTAYH